MTSRATNPAWFIKPKNYSELLYSNSSSVESLGKQDFVNMYLKKNFFLKLAVPLGSLALKVTDHEKILNYSKTQ